VNGLLVPPQNDAALTDAVTLLLTNEKWRTDMGKAGRRVVETMFCNEQNLLLLRDLFAGVLRGRAAISDATTAKDYVHAC
jgi:hypothetical protein